MLLVVLAGAAVYWTARIHRPIVGLGNHDVAGIAYNADVLLRGGLPYVDTAEIKAPGSFYLLAFAFMFLGRSIHTVHLACELWLCVGMVGLWWATTRVYTTQGGSLRTARWCAAVACALYWVSLASFQSNYTTWIVPPVAWCFAFAVHSWYHRGWWWPLLTGLCAGIALLIKANAVVLAPTVLVMWMMARRTGAPYASWSHWGLWIVGGVSAGVPLAAHYLLEGAGIEVLLRAVFPVNAAAAYSSRVVDAPYWYVPWRLVLHLEAKFPLQVMAVGAVLACTLADRLMGGRLLRRGEGLALALLLSFGVFSLVGGGLGGMRYFRHYAPQYLPALCILTVHPIFPRTVRAMVASLAGSWTRWRARGASAGGAAMWDDGLWRDQGRAHPWVRRAVVVGLWVTLLSLSVHSAVEIGRAGSRIMRGKYSHGWRPSTSDRSIADFVNKHSTPQERLFVWGWRGWSIYFYADRQAPTPMYKSLGTITTYNFNGMFLAKRSERPDRLHFVPGVRADELVEAFQVSPPAFVVRARPFFDGAKGDPMKEFKTLDVELKENYEQVFRSGKLVLLEHTPHRTARLKRAGKRRPSKKKKRTKRRAKKPSGAKKRAQSR